MKTEGIGNLIYWLDRVVDCGEKGMLAIETIRAEFITLQEENEKLRIMHAKVQKVLLVDEFKDALQEDQRKGIEPNAVIYPWPPEGKLIEIKIIRDAEKPRIRIVKRLYKSDGSIDVVYGLSLKTGEWIEIPEGEKCLEEMIYADETHNNQSPP